MFDSQNKKKWQTSAELFHNSTREYSKWNEIIVNTLLLIIVSWVNLQWVCISFLFVVYVVVVT